MDLKICFVVLLFSFIKPSSETLQSVSDDDLLELIREKEKLIVLFSKPNCDTCKELENHVESLENDFKKELNAVSVGNQQSLSSCESDENEIYGFFEKNQAPAVKELTDKIFEHITQAATGATTGDWFVMFYGASCVECQRLHAVWESVGATLKGRINVARMDANLAGVNTAKRFNVNKLPSFLFFRLGKVYRFDLPKKDVKSFVIFAQDWYKNAKAEPVPLLASPFDELVDLAVQMIKVSVAFTLDTLTEHPWIWQIGVAGFGLVAITAIIALCKAGKSRPSKDSKKEKKSK
ncbi:hypothetical protein SFRURICE_019265 [Spodoptera frugiperda]|nr:hypothetical protein SFRURICE_019265 [Spodoptera frugiperda]